MTDETTVVDSIKQEWAQKKAEADHAESDAAETTAVPEKPYHFRPLQGGDIFTMVSLLNKINVSDFTDLLKDTDIKNAVQAAKKITVVGVGTDNTESKTDDAEESVGIVLVGKFLNLILQKLPVCKEELYTLLSNTSDLTPEQINALPINDFVGMIKDFIMKDEFGSFFKGALNLISQ